MAKSWYPLPKVDQEMGYSGEIQGRPGTFPVFVSEKRALLKELRESEATLVRRARRILLAFVLVAPIFIFKHFFYSLPILWQLGYMIPILFFAILSRGLAGLLSPCYRAYKIRKAIRNWDQLDAEIKSIIASQSAAGPRQAPLDPA
jgi:hypothetical protein